MLPGLAALAGIARNPAITVEYGGSAADAPPFSQSMAIGTAAPNRKVLVCVAMRSTTATFGACTVAGQSCTMLTALYVDFGVDQQHIGMYLTDAPVVSGTTATVVWNSSDSTGLGGIAQTYAVYGAAAGAFDFDYLVATDPSLSLDVPAGGVLFGFSAVRTSSDACVWTGATEGGQASATSLETSIAAFTSDVAVAGRTIQATWTTGSVDMMIAASLRPE